jgi:hypothetical protein
MTTDPRELLDQLDALHAAGTPGPWQYDAEVADVVWDSDPDYPQITVRCAVDADAALIVAAVNAAPQLTAALRAVLDLADELERERGSVQGNVARLFAANGIRDAITAALSPAEAQP